MNKMIRRIILLLLMFILPVQFVSASTFDERLWEKYAAISTQKNVGKESLASINLFPHQPGDQQAKAPFSDLRVLNDRKEEIPWQIIQKRPEKVERELPATERNRSRTPAGESWVELVLAPGKQLSGVVEILTADTNFSRQVEVMGSSDGVNWNSIRKDGIIYDNSRGAGVRLTRITYPSSSFRYLAVKIADSGAPPLNISGYKVFENINSTGQTHFINGSVVKGESDKKAGESRFLATMNSQFPLDRISIMTPDQNFERRVEVQIKREGGEWQRWATGTIYNFDTDKTGDSHFTIEIPEIATREFQLVFKDMDSPPLNITGVSGEAYHRILVFKHDPERKFYLFWGNPAARMPQYDLGAVIAREKIDKIPLFNLESTTPNSKFAGDKARLPLTERYRYPLYGAVALAIAGLLALQYRVFKQMGKPIEK